jgi:hypothetical protein
MKLTTLSKTTALLEFTDTRFLGSNLTQFMDIWSHVIDRGLVVGRFRNQGAMLNFQSVKIKLYKVLKR